MSWNSHLEALSSSYPYNSAGSFMEYVEGLTYDHVNFIFDGPTQHLQETVHPQINTNYYKFGQCDPISYYNHDLFYGFEDHQPRSDIYRRPVDNSATNPQVSEIRAELGRTTNNSNPEIRVECPRRHPNGSDYQVIWQDSLDPDHMTYEELLELGETVGTQSRGLSQDLISLLPVSTFKSSFFPRKKSRKERCVICQMEYKRKERQITLPCKHVYHVDCGTKWLSINKACPICYTEVFGEARRC